MRNQRYWPRIESKRCIDGRRLVAAALAACLIAGNAGAVEPGEEALSSICVDAATGAVVSEHNADQARPPASMIKLVMMLLVAEGVDRGAWALERPITATAHAQQMGGTQVYVEAGDVFELGHLMKAVAVASANDAAMAVAEGLWGSEATYLETANARAMSLGMKNSDFHSVHGLPPSKGELPDKTTAREMAILARACLTHAQIREWVSMKEFQFRPEDTIHYNTNKLLWRMENCDGLKTGYIRAAGYCVTATAERGGRRMIAVVMGHPNGNRRFKLAEELIDAGFGPAQGAVAAAGEAEPGGTAETPEIEALDK